MGGQGYYRDLDQMGNQPVYFCRHRNPGIKIATNADAVYVYGAQPNMAIGNHLRGEHGKSIFRFPGNGCRLPRNTCRGTAYLDRRVFVMAPNGTFTKAPTGTLRVGTRWSS